MASIAHKMGAARAQAWFGLGLTVPALAGFFVLILGPFLASVYFALHEYRIDSAVPTFVGTRNLEALWRETTFWQSWRTTVLYVVVTTGLTAVLGTAYALFLNEPFRGRNIVRAASLLPWVLPSTVTAFLWAWMFHGQYGVINAALLTLGTINQPFFWLSTSNGALAAVILAKAWLSTPIVMLFVLAALQSLPMEQVEAARLDGAGDGAVLRYVVLPHISRTLGIVLVLQAMGNLQVFDVIYAMTAGGPVRATTVLSIEVYRRAFEQWNLGMAAAVGLVWFATIAGVALVYLRMLLKDND
ncbi:MAG: sugar ABC transporter permease [Alphaproteobacteria bacterium]|nr:sugar ABC transporter permease [Alphaproteobacteria bacterium]